MNMPSHRDEPEFTSQEWQAQERALRAERLDLADDGDERLRDYRRIVHALRQSPPDPLPADFADRVADRITRRRRDGFERLAGPLLMLVLIATGIGYGVGSAGAWWQDLITSVPSRPLTSPWLLGLAACAGLTAVLSLLPTPRRTHR